jgi:hypothetical protein
VKDKRSDIVLETKPKRFGIVPEFVLFRTDCFDLVQNLPPPPRPGPNRKKERKKEYLFIFLRHLQAHGIAIEMIFFDGVDSGENSAVWFHSCQMSERLWNVCFFTVLTLFRIRTMLLGRTEAPVRLGGNFLNRKKKVFLKVITYFFKTSARQYCLFFCDKINSYKVQRLLAQLGPFPRLLL